MIKIWTCKAICLFLFPFVFNSCNFAVYMLWFILSPILFNVFLNDLFLFIKKAELANFPNHSTLYLCNKDLTKLLKALQNECEIVIVSFKNNELLLILTISSRRLSVPKKTSLEICFKNKCITPTSSVSLQIKFSISAQKSTGT